MLENFTVLSPKALANSFELISKRINDSDHIFTMILEPLVQQYNWTFGFRFCHHSVFSSYQNLSFQKYTNFQKLEGKFVKMSEEALARAREIAARLSGKEAYLYQITGWKPFYFSSYRNNGL